VIKKNPLDRKGQKNKNKNLILKEFRIVDTLALQKILMVI